MGMLLYTAGTKGFPSQDVSIIELKLWLQSRLVHVRLVMFAKIVWPVRLGHTCSGDCVRRIPNFSGWTNYMKHG